MKLNNGEPAGQEHGTGHRSWISIGILGVGFIRDCM